MSLLIGLFMAVGRILDGSRIKEIKRVSEIAAKNINAQPVDGDDPINYGVALLNQKSEKLYKDVDATRTRARACYGFSVDVAIFALLAGESGSDIRPYLWMCVAFIVFVIMGFLHQKDYHSTLCISLKQIN
ncbi:hypothetical protein [Burkholderia sp. WAC0059]|uniref:hypothetical protein n=1 Tax=Burkholderia sp. WAC0059 TaxID=2066022 RepID=UPI0011AFA40A|nr:hypothetical protein [Burkholderia sp. WAC0059]